MLYLVQRIYTRVPVGWRMERVEIWDLMPLARSGYREDEVQPLRDFVPRAMHSPCHLMTPLWPHVIYGASPR